jgi:aldose 1-epimerase
MLSVLRTGCALAAMMIAAQPACARAGMTRALWGTTPSGRRIDIYTLTNAHGMQVQVSTYSGTIVSIRVPDRNGVMADVVMSHPDLAAYLKDQAAGGGGRYGETLGRYANRIGGAQFTLDGKTYRLATLNGAKDQLHGGPQNLSTRQWIARPHGGPNPSVTLTVKSPDGDQGFPGNVTVSVTYTLRADNALKLDYRATTDAPTVMNLTNHAYFNLKGEGDVSDTRVLMFAGRYTPSGAGSLPTGEIRSVTGSPYDFTTEKSLGEALAELATAAQPSGAPPRHPRGYDTNMVINGSPGTLRIAARFTEPVSGRVLEVWTTQPGFQFFTPGAPRDLNFLQRGFGARPAFCAETEHYPDSPNQPQFPSTEITPTHPLHETTVYRFGIDAGATDSGQ